MWNKGNKSDDDFKEQFGMTADELRAELAAAKEARDKATALETKHAETETTLQTLQAELAALKTPPPPTPGTRPEPTNFFVDPDKAFAERMAPLAQSSIQMAANLEEMKARQKYEREFKRWGKEIEELTGGDGQLASRTNPVFWQNAIDVIKGRHAAEIEESAAKGQFFFTESPGGSGPGGGADDTTFGLSKEQLASASRMNMSPKEFREALDYTASNYGHTKGASHVN